MQLKKILIIQTAFIGDVILTTPLLKGVKNAYKKTQIHIIVIPATKNLLGKNPFVDKIIVYDKRKDDKGLKGFIRLVRQLKKEKYDIVLSPHRSMRSALIALLTGAKKRIGFNTSAGSFLYTDKIHYIQTIHEIDRNLSLVEALETTISDRQPKVFVDHQDIESVKQLLATEKIDTNNPLIAVAPGSVWFTKKWPDEYFKELVKKLAGEGYTVFLIGGDADEPDCRHIVQAANGSVYNLAGKLTLRESAALLKKCKVLVSNDSGALHLAVAAGTHVIAIFGPTVPAFGFYPYGENHTIIEQTLDCRPCGIHGGPKCPIGTHECMKAIKPLTVFQSVLKYTDPDNKQ
ncbi:lipopolysaccharide heptosyltransferase II [candidate division KSB1 bacterium]|nr:lipopolysaccharide heptosyltransferase II [candidate division KSB1 bacterium]